MQQGQKLLLKYIQTPSTNQGFMINIMPYLGLIGKTLQNLCFQTNQYLCYLDTMLQLAKTICLNLPYS